MSEKHEARILLTGATGYVGGRLLKALEQAGHSVRCLARQPPFLQPKVRPTTEVVGGDVLDPHSLTVALDGVHTAYYLIHSMRSTQDFEAIDRQAAEHFADAARQAGVARIVYLGGLGDSSSALSPHLRSRQEVGTILQRSGAQVEDQEFAETRWSDALSSGGVQRTWGGVRFGTRIVDTREVEVSVPPALAFAPIRRIGGNTGWYYANTLWRVRGFLDLLVGGVGSRRGRRDAERLYPGETVDFWRVETFEMDRRLRLVAEMKVPGRAWLEFEVEGDAAASRIHQTAIFDPVGLWGQLYWYALYPLHGLIFAGMLRNIARAAHQEAQRQNEAPVISQP